MTFRMNFDFDEKNGSLQGIGCYRDSLIAPKVVQDAFDEVYKKVVDLLIHNND